MRTTLSTIKLNRAASAVVEHLEGRLHLSAANVLTYRDDAAATGVNAAEVALTPANVKTGSFGKVFTTPLDDVAYAEPLVDTGVTIGNGVNTSVGAAGVHDVVYVATESDSLYAIDATGGAVLWKRSFLDTTNPVGDQNNTLGATSLASPTNLDVGTGNAGERFGLTGTPVIDSTTNLMYLVVKTKEVIGTATHFVQRVHAINIADGTDASTPYLIGDTSGPRHELCQ